MQPSDLAPRIPHRLDARFIGREEFVANLSQFFNRKDSGNIQVLYGPSGVGKSRIAAEYVRRFASQYQFIGWADAADLQVLAGTGVIRCTDSHTYTLGSELFEQWVVEHCGPEA
jgi:hypothetical protein